MEVQTEGDDRRLQYRRDGSDLLMPGLSDKSMIIATTSQAGLKRLLQVHSLVSTHGQPSRIPPPWDSRKVPLARWAGLSAITRTLWNITRLGNSHLCPLVCVQGVVSPVDHRSTTQQLIDIV